LRNWVQAPGVGEFCRDRANEVGTRMGGTTRQPEATGLPQGGRDGDHTDRDLSAASRLTMSQTDN